MKYVINILRKEDEGILQFRHQGVHVKTTCWWDPEVVVDPGIYRNCAATYMANKKDTVTGERRPGIWLGSSVPVNDNARKANGIFIHEGKSAGWSDGCIIIRRKEVIKIFDALPLDEHVVTIQIANQSQNTPRKPQRKKPIRLKPQPAGDTISGFGQLW